MVGGGGEEDGAMQLWACSAPQGFFQRQELDEVPASSQKCQTEGITGFSLNTSVGISQGTSVM